MHIRPKWASSLYINVAMDETKMDMGEWESNFEKWGWNGNYLLYVNALVLSKNVKQENKLKMNTYKSTIKVKRVEEELVHKIIDHLSQLEHALEFN